MWSSNVGSGLKRCVVLIRDIEHGKSVGFPAQEGQKFQTNKQWGREQRIVARRLEWGTFQWHRRKEMSCWVSKRRNSKGHSLRRRFILSRKQYIFPNWSNISWKYQSSSSISFFNDNAEAVSGGNGFIAGDIVCTDRECCHHLKRTPPVPMKLQ